MGQISPPIFRGPAFFSYGFRPFFLSAGVFACVIVPAWLLILTGRLELPGPFAPVDWHVHEMLFGYGSIVLAGFLFTAVPNWTGRAPLRGTPLVLLLGLWILGRAAVAGAFPLGAISVLLIEASFPASVLAIISAEVIAGRNWRNLVAVAPLLVFLAADVVFHLEVRAHGNSDVGRRLGFAALIFLIMLIGGRIIPSFTRNWLSKRGADRLPAPFGRFDASALLAGAAAQALWIVWPLAAGTGLALLAAAALHALRMARWQGARTLASPLLAMLHVAYAFIPLGLATLGLTALTGTVPIAAGLHLLGIGAVGGMTLAVMIRATMGHTGGALVAGPALTTAFLLLMAAALVRALAGELEVAGISGATVAAMLWTVAFGLFVARLAPHLLRPVPRQDA